MPLPSFLQRLRHRAADTPSVSEVVPLSPADIEATRTRARRRLVGMVVLVGAGVVGFPWLFETQPRPLSPNVQIVQAGDGHTTPNGHPRPMASGKVAVAGIVAPQASEAEADGSGGGGGGGGGGATTPSAVTPEPRVVAVDPVKEAVKEAGNEAVKPSVKVDAREPREEILRDKQGPKKSEAVEARPDKKPELTKQHEKSSGKAVDKAVDKEAVKPAEKATEKPSDKDAPRYIVQIGAFGDAKKAQDVRLKVERLGIKTYTQAVETPEGKRIRVRVGPYADKAEADKAMATLRKAGLGGNLLTL